MPSVSITNVVGGSILGPSFVVYGTYSLAIIAGDPPPPDRRKTTVEIKCRLEERAVGQDPRLIQEKVATVFPDQVYWEAAFDLTTGTTDPYGTNRVLVPSIRVGGSGNYDDGPVVGFVETRPEGAMKIGIDRPMTFGGSTPTALDAEKHYKAKGKCEFPEASIGSFESKVTHLGVLVDTKAKTHTDFPSDKWKLKVGKHHDLTGKAGKWVVHDVIVLTTTSQRFHVSIRIQVEP